MAGTYVLAEINLDDVIGQVEVETIARWLSERGVGYRQRDVAITTINAIRAGRLVDAVTELEREFLPKWKDCADCEAAYRVAMAAKGES